MELELPEQYGGKGCGCREGPPDNSEPLRGLRVLTWESGRLGYRHFVQRRRDGVRAEIHGQAYFEDFPFNHDKRTIARSGLDVAESREAPECRN
jgi:hypothetical protein